MTRYFFREARHALNALLDHGIHTSWGMAGSGGTVTQTEQALRYDVAYGAGDDGLYYIHPDSLHLLQPRIWDIGQRMQGVPQVLCTPTDYEDFERHGIGRNYIPLGSLRIDAEFRIIQRGGKPFQWPEREL